MVSPAAFIFCHPDDETVAAGVSIAEHVAAGQDVHLLWLTRGTGSSVLGKLNATSPTPNPWWGVMHDPAAEGYGVLDLDQFGQARIDEGSGAADCLSAGLPGSLTLREAGLLDGAVTAEDAQAAILAMCDEIAPGMPVRLKSHTYVPELDTHSDHLAAGTAVRNLAAADPARFGDVRHYLLPPHWTSSHLNLVSEAWDLPSNADIAARAVNACRVYGAWAPQAGRYAIGHHSTYAYFATVMAGPKCLFHP
jgi:LmbE family N-acetylglucosaminyl deacetylase